jgi:hypothetical protein
MSAIISKCGLYRYTLERRWNQADYFVLWIMLNPSTADETTDDATIRRCKAFSKAWGYGGLLVGNLYAYRSPTPNALWACQDVIGPGNDLYLTELAKRAALIVCAWGQRGPTSERRDSVLKILRAHGTTHALAFTKGGEPRHPLYLPGNLKPEVWNT